MERIVPIQTVVSDVKAFQQFLLTPERIVEIIESVDPKQPLKTVLQVSDHNHKPLNLATEIKLAILKVAGAKHVKTRNY